MREIITQIFDLLSDDILDHGLLTQFVEQFNIESKLPPLRLNDVIDALLSSGEVEIGETKKVSFDYVEFIGWKGTVAQRLSRATKSVDAASGSDRAFAYWLCLRKNVDRYEVIESDGL